MRNCKGTLVWNLIPGRASVEAVSRKSRRVGWLVSVEHSILITESGNQRQECMKQVAGMKNETRAPFVHSCGKHGIGAYSSFAGVAGAGTRLVYSGWSSLVTVAHHRAIAWVCWRELSSAWILCVDLAAVKSMRL